MHFEFTELFPSPPSLHKKNCPIVGVGVGHAYQDHSCTHLGVLELCYFIYPNPQILCCIDWKHQCVTISVFSSKGKFCVIDKVIVIPTKIQPNLATKYEGSFSKHPSIFLATYLNHIQKSGDFSLNFSLIPAIEIFRIFLFQHFYFVIQNSGYFYSQ